MQRADAPFRACRGSTVAPCAGTQYRDPHALIREASAPGWVGGAASVPGAAQYRAGAGELRGGISLLVELQRGESSASVISQVSESRPGAPGLCLMAVSM